MGVMEEGAMVVIAAVTETAVVGAATAVGAAGTMEAIADPFR